MQNEWVICRVFQKSSGGKKIPITGLTRLGNFGSEIGASFALPPLTDSPSPYASSKSKPIAPDSTNVPCFSNNIPMDLHRHQQGILDTRNNNNNNNNLMFGVPSSSSQLYATQSVPVSSTGMQYQNQALVQDQSMIFRALFQSNGPNPRQSFKAEREIGNGSQQDQTVMNSDINAEISSVMANLQMGRKIFCDQNPASASAGPGDLEGFWNY